MFEQMLKYEETQNFVKVQADRLCLISHPHGYFSAFTSKLSHAQLVSCVSHHHNFCTYKPSVVLMC